ncbi:hypothetical protein NQ317_001114 [Molorchus minor]|uniref:Uncharacterized protein n=1 Tax=Molorchus minor TaxID=1323400 RepID=A0ABQ9JJR1_9CUCU|nr:hypothetical protein NQ317_001114 [Molorchus minor]
MESIEWVSENVRDHRRYPIYFYFRRPYGPPTRDTRLKRRAILKNGDYNILPPKFKRRYFYYVRDCFTGLVDAEWKWTLQFLAIGFVGGWLIFSLIWWLIMWVHMDLHEDHLPAQQAETGWTPCVLNIHGWPSCFLFSLETQHTTGYGLRVITEECPEAIFIMCMQCIIGMIIDTFTVGVVVAKMMRPRLTHYTVQFSRNAVVCLRDGELCLMYRIGDLKKSRMCGVAISALLIQNKSTKEGETLNSFQSELDVECDDSGSDLFFIWPVTVVHKINEDSPFYNLSASDMLQEKFEIVAFLDGTVESTGIGTNAKTSYLSNEILWGHRFEPMVSYNEKLECYEANYANFEKVVRIDMPMCSAANLAAAASEADDNDEDENNDTKSISEVQSKTSREVPSRKRQSSRATSKSNTEATPPFPVSDRPSNLSINVPSSYTNLTSPQVPSRDTPSRHSSLNESVSVQRQIHSQQRSVHHIPVKQISTPEPFESSRNMSSHHPSFSETTTSRRRPSQQTNLSSSVQPPGYLPYQQSDVQSPRDTPSEQSSYDNVQPQRPISEQYESKKYIFEGEQPASKYMGRPIVNRYEYLHSTEYETIYEEDELDERSETPPFPVNWV